MKCLPHLLWHAALRCSDRPTFKKKKKKINSLKNHMQQIVPWLLPHYAEKKNNNVLSLQESASYPTPGWEQSSRKLLPFFFLLCQQQQIGDFSTFPPPRLQSWSGARARACARGRRDETTGAGILPGHVGIQNNQSGHRQSRKIINRTLTALIGRISGKVFIRYLQLFFLCCCGRCCKM